MDWVVGRLCGDGDPGLLMGLFFGQSVSANELFEN